MNILDHVGRGGTPKTPKNGDKGRHKPFIIGVCGGTASGKTSVCQKIYELLDNQRVASISTDSFYRALTTEERSRVQDYNFDHPDAFDWDLIISTLKYLSQGKCVKIPQYDFTTHSRTQETIQIYGSVLDVILVEGILLFHNEEVRKMLDMKLFVDTDADIRLARRVRRDLAERGRQLDNVLIQYERFVKPAFDQFILPTKKFADIVIPRGATNTVAIDLIVQHTKLKLAEKQADREHIDLLFS